ncbi:MAG: ABC transporter substrate-binding protein [Firmicutes bacterium]|nr:ABC transporter substrate-binding protein [Bacillota bacterium]
MNRKRLLSVLLIVVLSLSLASGAFAKGLVRITYYFPVGLAGPLATVMNEYVDEFNALHAEEIEVVPVYSGDYDPTMQKVQTAVQGGNPPDVFIVEISELPTLLAMDAIIPLNEFADEEYLADFFPAFLENSYTADGQFWGVPFQRSTPVFYWNKDHFREVGLDPDVPPTTWDEVAEFAQKLVVRDENNEVERWGVTISGGWNDWIFQGFARQNSSQLIDFVTKSITINSPEALEALEFWVHLTQELKVAPPHSTWSSTPPDFVAGRTSMLYHSTGVLTFMKESAGFDFGVGFMPANTTYGAEVGGGNLHIGKGIPRENQEAAWKLIEFLTTPEMAARWSRASGYVSTRVSSYDLPEMVAHTTEHPEYLVARNQLDYASGKMMTPIFQRVREIVKTALDEATAGKITPKAALDRAQDQTERLLRDWLD